MPRGKLNKSDFVRSMEGVPAREVVAAAAKSGIKLTERYVYVIRSADKAKARKRAFGGAGGSRRGGDGEAALRRAIAELGLATARTILREMERAFAR